MNTLIRIVIASTALLAVSAVKLEEQDLEQGAQISSDFILDDATKADHGLAQKTTVTTKVGDDDPLGIGGFIAGCLLIPFSLVLLWKNEKKVVTYAKLLHQAKEECVDITDDQPADENDYRLVHVTGTTLNQDKIEDEAFGAFAENSYRLVRTVEMYQWKENQSTKREGDTETTTYTYEKGWFAYPISSAGFQERDKRNPTKEWPFMSETKSAETVTMGKFKLNQDQIAKLGQKDESWNWKDGGAAACENTTDTMKGKGFEPLRQDKGSPDYLISSAEGDASGEHHIGSYRIKFHYNVCGEATLMAQQVQDKANDYTFRKWNPEKKMVPYGESTDAEMDQACGSPVCCYICMCVNCMMHTMFEEVVDFARDGNTSQEAYFKEQEATIGLASKIIRPVGILLCIFGFYLLFSPVIALLDMIPFVGWLLSGIVAVAAVIFAIVVGLTLSVLTIAVAWVFFRPLIGIPLLLAVAASVYLVFFYQWGGESVAETTTAQISSSNVWDGEIDNMQVG